MKRLALIGLATIVLPNLIFKAPAQAACDTAQDRTQAEESQNQNRSTSCSDLPSFWQSHQYRLDNDRNGDRPTSVFPDAQSQRSHQSTDDQHNDQHNNQRDSQHNSGHGNQSSRGGRGGGHGGHSGGQGGHSGGQGGHGGGNGHK